MFKKLFWGSALLSLLLLLWSNVAVYSTSKGYLYDKVENVPSSDVALLLGTSKYTKRNTLNQYFIFRIDAAVRLFEAGKVKYILISGDNGSKDYNEPEDMKQELIKRGIPESKIVLDYAGFDTYDSVLRAKRVFGQNNIIVVSQKFHNQRAVYIGRKNELTIYGFNTKEVRVSYSFLTKFR
jgi:SanA protein